MWNNSQLSCHFREIMQIIQRTRCRNKYMGRNSKLPAIYTWWYILQYVLKVTLCSWWKEPQQPLDSSKNGFLKYFQRNCRTAFFRTLLYEHSRLQWLWYIILLHERFGRWNNIQLSFSNKEGKKNYWAQVNYLNPFLTNVPLTKKPDSWFLLANCLKNTCGRVTC